jgi:antitoxin HicB
VKNFIYPVKLEADVDDGGFVVSFRDLPEAITQGDSIEEALNEAADCLEEAIAGRMVMGLEIPAASTVRQSEYPIILPAQMAAKAALYLAMREEGMTKTELAKRMGCDEKEIRRLLDPRHASKVPRIETALLCTGKRLVVGFENAA